MPSDDVVPVNKLASLVLRVLWPHTEASAYDSLRAHQIAADLLGRGIINIEALKAVK